MKDTPLNRFLEEIMAINTGFIGMGSASAGIIGATNSNDESLNNLRKHALEFANEYTDPKPNANKLNALSQELEGSLRTVKVFHAISDDKFDHLVSSLDALMEVAERS